jgi:pimeloyl-ACP methyl ester carboxylesterase
MKFYKSENARKNILDTYDKLLDLWNVDKEERDITTTYGTTHVITCGDENNPPLVLFHGVGDDSALMWLYNAKSLSRHFRLYVIDTIGGPGKSRPNENYNKTFDDVKWIDETLAGLTLDKMYIAGVSHGAYLSQLYMLHRPDKIIKIVCMASSVSVGKSGPMKTMMKIFLPEALFPTERNTIKLLKKLCGKNSRVFIENPIVLEHFRCLLKGYNNMAMRYHKIERFNDKQVDAIREKSLFLVGEDDPFMKLGGKDELLQYKMNVQFFPEVGHGINHEISEEINLLIIKYLSEQVKHDTLLQKQDK